MTLMRLVLLLALALATAAPALGSPLQSCAATPAVDVAAPALPDAPVATAAAPSHLAVTLDDHVVFATATPQADPEDALTAHEVCVR